MKVKREASSAGLSLVEQPSQYRQRLKEIAPRILTALHTAATKAQPVTDEERQQKCVELDWLLDTPQNASAMDEFDKAIHNYCEGTTDEQELGRAVNAYIDAHKIRWTRGVPLRFQRGEDSTNKRVSRATPTTGDRFV